MGTHVSRPKAERVCRGSGCEALEDVVKSDIEGLRMGAHPSFISINIGKFYLPPPRTSTNGRWPLTSPVTPRDYQPHGPYQNAIFPVENPSPGSQEAPNSLPGLLNGEDLIQSLKGNSIPPGGAYQPACEFRAQVTLCCGLGYRKYRRCVEGGVVVRSGNVLHTQNGKGLILY